MKILIILAILLAAYLVYRAFSIEPTDLPLEPVVEEPEVDVIEETMPDDEFRKMLLIAAGIILSIIILIAAALVL